MSLSADGRTVAVGAYGNDDDGNLATGTVKIESIQDCFSAASIADGFVTSKSDGSDCTQNRPDRPSGCAVNTDVNQLCFNSANASTVIPSNFPSWAAPLCKVRRYLHGQIGVNSCPAGTVKVDTI